MQFDYIGGGSGQISEHFRYEEFRCKGRGCCGGSAPISLELVRVLEDLRGVLCARFARDVPVYILSGFRCLSHNRSVGSQDTSMHTLGLAADIYVSPNISLAKVAIEGIRVMPSVTVGGFGLYEDKGFLHIDVGPRRFWGDAAHLR